MEHSQVDGPLYRKLEGAIFKKVIEYPLHSHAPPQTPEDQVRPQLLRWSFLQVPRLHQPHPLPEACQGAQQRVSGTGSGKLIEPTQGQQHLLHRASALPVILHQLEVAIWSADLNSKEQAASPNSDTASLNLVIGRCQ